MNELNIFEFKTIIKILKNPKKLSSVSQFQNIWCNLNFVSLNFVLVFPKLSQAFVRNYACNKPVKSAYEKLDFLYIFLKGHIFDIRFLCYCRSNLL